MRRMLTLAMASLAAGCAFERTDAAETTVPVVISGGHETDPQDRGRPVTLVAAGLGVSPEVFREAFRGVTPARDGRPTESEAQRNKEALMKVLRPHGVTNDRLDEVSNHYRYRRERGELWPTQAAKAHAVIVDGRVARIVVTEPGAGYSSAPMIRIPGHDDVKATAKVKFEKDLKRNGAVESIDVRK